MTARQQHTQQHGANRLSCAAGLRALLSGGRVAVSAAPAAGLTALGAVLLCLTLLLLLPLSAQAAPPQLWNKCDADEPAGQRCSLPRGIAADSGNGHVFVADQSNNRIVEFSALGEFARAWGWDVVASGPGDDTVAPEDQLEVCVPRDGDICKTGSSGSGDGQLPVPQDVAVDSDGDIYVVDLINQRVQKFSPAGDFLLMFGGDVNKTKLEEGAPEAERNLCTAASGDICQAGVEGTGNGQFSWPLAPSDFLAIDDSGTATAADDKVYVVDVGRIQRFDTGGVYQAEIALSGPLRSLAVDSSGNLYRTVGGGVQKLSPSGVPLQPNFKVTTPDGNPATPTAVAVDSAGHVYAFGPTTFSGGQKLNPIFEFDSAGNIVDNFGINEFNGSTGLATNLCEGSEAPGNLYVTNASIENAFVRAYGTAPDGCVNTFTGEATNVAETAVTLNGTVDPNGSAVSECRFEYGLDESYGSTVPCAEGPAEIGEGDEPVPVHADISGLTKGTVYHFRLRATIGAAAEKGGDKTFKTLGPPVISEAHTAGATADEATLKALVNPEGFATTYRFEYGLTDSYGSQTPVFSAGSDRSNHVALTTLVGLAPDTTYHWRIVATNESGSTAGPDRLVTTYPSFALKTDCPNQAFRIAAAAFLPDCRAYEMVSPVDKNGRDIVIGLAGTGDPAGYIQSSPDGNKVTYTATVSFGDQPNSFAASQYLAARHEGAGWSNNGIHPPAWGSLAAPEFAFGYAREFMAFSPDLCSAWLRINQTPPPTAEGQVGYINLYRRDNCDPGAGGLEALAPAPPALLSGTPDNYVSNTSVQGLSEDGGRVFFVAEGAPLPHVPDANSGTNGQIYERIGGGLELVSVLPNGNADTAWSEVGSGWNHNLDNAVSADGSRVYWTSGINQGSGTGKIFLRQHPEQGKAEAECTAGKACTRQVSGPFSALFWTAADDGSKALYSELDQLTEETGLIVWDLGKAEAGTPPRRTVAADVEGVAGASEDLSRIYFVSRDALPGSGQNSEDDEAVAGEPNLYLDEEGTIGFVATLAESDVGEKEPGAAFSAYELTGQPFLRATRVTPDGSHLAFQSRAPLTEFDNSEAEGGRPAVEVFHYEAGGELICVSCNPSGARPSARELPIPYRTPGPGAATNVPAAAWIPTWEHPLHASNVLSESGNRLFFNSNDRLVPRDTNEAQDVYEWQAPGTGSCSEASPSYFEQNGGCLDLISSGESSFESTFWEASPNGRDVFFTTESSLLPQDPGLVDLYDARERGGFPQPIVKAACEGEACQSPPPPPEFPTPSSEAYRGPGNPKPPRSCRGPAKRAQNLSRRAKRQRRASRRAARNGKAGKAKQMRRNAGRLGRRAKGLSRKAKRCRRQNRRAAR